MKKSFFRRTEFKLFLTVWLVYIFFLSNYGGGWMADSTLALTKSIVDDQSLIIDDYVKGAQDNAFVNGHYYSGFAPGASFLAVPVYFVLKPLFWIFDYFAEGYDFVLLNIVATIFISSLLSALTAVILFKFLRNFISRKKSLFLSFISSFATLFFLYSTGYYNKVLAVFFSFFAFYLVFKNKNSKEGNYFYPGILAGFGVLVDYMQVIPLFLIFIYMISFYRGRKIIDFCAGALIPIIVLLVYHSIVFGSVFSTPYDFRANEPQLEAIEEGFSVPDLERAYGISFSSFRGFFFYMPIMFLIFFGFYKGMRSKFWRESLLCFLLFLAYFTYNISLSNILTWAGGCSFGPRHLVPVIPFAMLLVGFSFNIVNKAVVYVLSAVSGFFNLLPVLYGRSVLWLGDFCYDKNIIFNQYISLIFERGFTNYTLNIIKYKFYDIPVLWINLVSVSLFLILLLVIYFIWRE